MDQAPLAPHASFSNRNFGRLPYDAWHECIRFAAMQSVEGPLPYLAVSSSWADSIIASPILWTTIIFDDYREDQEARLHTFSHLSQDLPLYLIYIYSSDGKTIERFINNHRLRIRSIEDEYGAGEMLSTVLGTITTSLPALRYLESWDDISERFFSNCVNLRVVQSPQVRIVDEACLGPHVESICFNDVEPSSIVNLTHRTNIRTLGLSLWRRGDGPFWDEKTGEPFKAPMANLFTKISQTLSNLSLWISFDSYSVFIPLVSSIPGLHTLSLYLNVTRSLQNGFSQFLTPPIRHSDVKNLRDLSIILFGASHFDEDDEDRGDWAGFNPGPADAFIQSLTVGKSFKELKYLSFDCGMPYHESHLGPLLQSAISAREVHAFGTDGMIPTSLRMERQLMPRLQSLTLPSLALYSCIDAPNLIKLDLSADTIIGEMPVETNDTTHLQKLTLPARLMNNAGVSMHSLWNSNSIKFISDICPQDITPLSRLESVEFSHRVTAAAANEFLFKILESPKACPQLSVIRISGYPLWELLFEVLRKRNSSGLRRITQITLPRLPVLQLLWRLVRLLSGETAVFTNRDVDEVIVKRLACPQM
jgi:hypothetical protein